MVSGNFIELGTFEEANKIDLTRYTFVGLKDDRGYCFKIKAKYVK